MYQCALILIKRQQSSARRRLANPAQARGLLLRLVLTKLAGRIDLRVLAQHRRRFVMQQVIRRDRDLPAAAGRVDHVGRNRQSAGVAAIAVHCPEPVTWFDLIGASEPAGDESQKEAAITAFGRLMGDSGGAAMNLARSRCTPGKNCENS